MRARFQLSFILRLFVCCRGMGSGTVGPQLAPEEIAAIAARLEAGEYLDDYYRSRLFPESKEVVLTYAGKTPRGVVLAETMAVPFQTLKRFGDADGSGWTNKLVFGDNLQALKTLLEMKARGELRNPDGTDGFRVCYIDPPFASRRDFRAAKGQQAYRDKVAGAEFVEFLRKRLIFIHELLTEDGTLYVHLDPKKGHYMKVVLDELFGASNFRNEVIWHYYNKMQGNIDRFPSNHDCIYVYGKAPGTLFETVYEEREETATLIKRIWDGDKKKLVNAKGPDGKVVYIEREDKRVDDVWRLSMLQPADRTERVDYPTQKPATLLSIVLAASSKPGDLVLDAFVGSGTTAVVAERLGRRWVAIDCGKLAIYTTQRRLLSMKKGKGKRAKAIAAGSFEVCSAGHYDNALLEELPFEDWEPFCLELFGCRAEPFTIAGVPMSGKRKGDPVHTFPFHETEGEMGELYVETLHARLRGKVGRAVYIITPAAACDPGLFQDIFTYDGTSYFILRVPYSVIRALHARDFEQPEQPASKNEVNDALDAYGFDFVQVPDVDTTLSLVDSMLHGNIKSFRRGGLDPDELEESAEGGREDLAMLMVDTDYDGEVFRVETHMFAEDLEANEWVFEVELAPAAERILLVFMDTLGNERREVVELASLRAPRRAKKGVGRRRTASPA
jgi:site-specific DNA-methyltransferase (adenine-specific)/adenine-specific DNA-methyltransferase